MTKIQEFNEALKNGLSKEIFDHVRNYLICALILAIGANEFNQHESSTYGFISSEFSGVGVIALALILMFINFYDGIRRISSVKFHNLFIIILALMYLFVSLRIVEIAWYFRSSPI